MKKIVEYKVELVYAVSPPTSHEEKPWCKTGLGGWVPWGDPVAVHAPGKEDGRSECLVFQAFVKYED